MIIMNLEDLSKELEKANSIEEVEEVAKKHFSEDPVYISKEKTNEIIMGMSSITLIYKNPAIIHSPEKEFIGIHVSYQSSTIEELLEGELPHEVNEKSVSCSYGESIEKILDIFGRDYGNIVSRNDDRYIEDMDREVGSTHDRKLQAEGSGLGTA